MIDGLWEKANKVSEIGYKLDSLAGIAELVAERLTDNAESGACWTVAEMLHMYGEQLERLSEDIMAIQRIKLDKSKGKKK
jgi:hypothetical protein